MLFGRRKPGFVQTVKVDDLAASAKEGTVETTATKTDEATISKSNENPDLLEYLASLPDVEDDYVEFEETGEEQPEEEMTEAKKLADYIRARSAAANLTKYSVLKEEIEDLDQLLAEIETTESYQDIAHKQGKKDKYFYSSLNMSDNYAMIISMVEDKDLTATIAQMVRFHCSTYPTPLSYFERHPYYATRPQIERAIALMSNNEEYSDIQRLTNNVNKDFLFSTKLMSEKYARALAKEEEYTD